MRTDKASLKSVRQGGTLGYGLQLLATVEFLLPQRSFSFAFKAFQLVK